MRDALICRRILSQSFVLVSNDNEQIYTIKAVVPENVQKISTTQPTEASVKQQLKAPSRSSRTPQTSSNVVKSQTSSTLTSSQPIEVKNSVTNPVVVKSNTNPTNNNETSMSVKLRLLKQREQATESTPVGTINNYLSKTNRFDS